MNEVNAHFAAGVFRRYQSCSLRRGVESLVVRVFRGDTSARDDEDDDGGNGKGSCRCAATGVSSIDSPCSGEAGG